MNRNELIKFAEEFYNNNIEISKRKNKDYAGHDEGSDPFANFRVCESLGIPSEQGFIVRMCDKMSRISSLADGTKAAVNDEAISDTLADLANYAMLMAAFLEEKNESD